MATKKATEDNVQVEDYKIAKRVVDELSLPKSVKRKVIDQITIKVVEASQLDIFGGENVQEK